MRKAKKRVVGRLIIVASATIMAALMATLGGCFALFSLDDYGPPADQGLSDSAAPDAPIGQDTGSGDTGSGPVEAGVVEGGKVVFVTDNQFAANDDLLRDGKNASALCNDLAKDAGIAGTFGAWLSANQQNTPASTFPGLAADASASAQGPLVTPTHLLIATSYKELAKDGPRISIAVTEKKKTLPDAPAAGGNGDACPASGLVWTGTAPNGTRDVGGTPVPVPAVTNCQDWKAANMLEKAIVGQISNKSDKWTKSCALACNEKAHIYCFEQ